MARHDTRMLVSLLTLASVVELRDPYTGGHLWRVGTFARRIAGKAGLDARTAYLATLGGFLHDVGKIGVPDALLRNTGPLTHDEFQTMKTHPALGAALLHEHPLSAVVIDSVRHHHERPDGLGYPDALAGEAIPVVARVVAVADAFDAMTSTRSYRRAMTIETALEIVTAERGRQFEPAFADALVALHRTDDALRPVVGHSDHGRPLETCPACGPIVAIPRAKGAGDTVVCRSCGTELRLHDDGEGRFELERIGRTADPLALAPVPETDVFAEVLGMAEPRPAFFIGRLAHAIGFARSSPAGT
jgi:hypothetical protein